MSVFNFLEKPSKSSYIMLYHISKIHSSSSSTTFACDARQSRKENYFKLQFSHATELCRVALYSQLSQKTLLTFQRVTMPSVFQGCGFILGIIFFILGINFFLRFQLEVETFQVGWAVPAEEVGLKKKNSWRGVGG